MSIKPTLTALEQLAQERGYSSYYELLYDMYVMKGMSLHAVGESLHIYDRRVRKHLLRFGIAIRGKGGPNNVKVELTEDLLREINVNGISVVADRMGVSYQSLLDRLKRHYGPKPT